MCLSCTIEEVTGFDLATEEGHLALEEYRAANGGRIPWPEATEEMEEAAAYVAALYANPAGGTGGPLHITTDDYNVSDSNLDFCRKNIETWTGYDSTPAQQNRAKVISDWILDLLEPMTDAERSIVMALAHGSLRVVHGQVFMPATEFPIRERIEDDEGNYVGTQWGFRSHVQPADQEER